MTKNKKITKKSSKKTGIIAGAARSTAKYHYDLLQKINFSKNRIHSEVISKSHKHEITLMCLSRGSSIGTHTSTRHGLVQVLKGKGIFKRYNKKITLRPGILITMPPHAQHSLRAEENFAILLTLIK